MRTHHLTRAKVALASFALAATAAACGGGDDAAAGDDKHAWGINAELSGNVAFYGESLQAGVKAYVDQVNKDGGIDGHEIDLTSVDNAGDSSRSATNATQLITSDEVSAMFGFVLSANCSAATPVVERYTVPLACLSVAESSDYVYNLGPNSARMGGALLEAAKEVSGKDAPKAALVHLNTLTVLALAEAIKEQADGAGVDLVTSQELDLAATDVSPQVAKVVASKPDVVIVSNFGPGFLAVLKAVRSAGLDVPVVWADGTGNLTSLEESTDENVYAMTAYELVDPDNATGVAVDYIDAISPTLKEVNAVTLNAGYTAMAYITANAFGQATKECGHPCSGKDLAKVLSTETFDMEGLVSDFSYEGDHYPFSDWYLYQVTGPKYEKVSSFDVD
ncbi:ABC transporter substrate-binding protein [Aeromicrobium choanae]|uniref:ABC-type branched-chain amino acid transport system, substrate-binding protein n=1 Tax=Aeromicrobium choanae TaxID=1736691 RepID=A0A1T4YWP1_9ACTN|nr:ABC transporter substrate-binding protein [Aeromicrobium choanae]SKB06192.1 ABC-type branched-chain amino acid transport system, substrate-binding protein [Aeromicrobium choanae]